MFNDVNEVRLIGNVTNDPDLRFTPSGAAVLSFGLATNRRYKKSDEWVDEPTFHNVIVWGQYAQNLAPRIKKGTRAYVAGRISVRSWDGSDGKKQYKTEIVSEEVNLLARYNEGTNAELGVAKSSGAPSAQAPSRQSKQQPDFAASAPAEDTGIEVDNASIDPDELPF